MVKVKENLVGKKFNRLTVVEQTEDYIYPNGKHIARWLCLCECGNPNLIPVIGIHLKSNNTTSCGCVMREKVAENGKNNKRYNEYDLTGEYGVGWTSNTSKEFYFDLEDYDKIKDYCWHEHICNGFSTIKTNDPETRKSIKMHTLLGFKGYDHIDRNELNNRKQNLRKCTQQENTFNQNIRKDNTSGVTGVTWDKKRQKWCAGLHINRKHKFLGYFINKDDAIIARLKAEQKYFKEFAPQMHLYEQYDIE